MKRVLLGLLMLGSVLSLTAQTGGGIRMYDEQPEVETPRKLNKRGKSPANVIKFSFLSPFRGDYALQYERRILPWFSAQAGIGFTLRDKIYERFTSGVFNSPDFKTMGGYSAKLGFRFYPIADGWMSGTFFSPDFAYRQYNLSASLTQYDTNNNPSTQNLRLGYAFKEYRLLVGQSYDFLFRNLYLEYYFGLVFRDVSESTPLYQNNDQGAYYTRTTQSHFSPGIAFNASVGYAF